MCTTFAKTRTGESLCTHVSQSQIKNTADLKFMYFVAYMCKYFFNIKLKFCWTGFINFNTST